jgi:hypothetical protein
MNVIDALTARAEDIRRRELDRSRRHLGDDPRAGATADEITVHIVEQLLAPVFASIASSDSPADRLDYVQRAFHLDGVADAQLRIDRPTRRLAVHLIDDILNALELWQSAGDTDARWVHAVWTLRITPRIGIHPPFSAADAADGAYVYSALLELQMALAEDPR